MELTMLSLSKACLPVLDPDSLSFKVSPIHVYMSININLGMTRNLTLSEFSTTYLGVLVLRYKLGACAETMGRESYVHITCSGVTPEQSYRSI